MTTTIRATPPITEFEPMTLGTAGHVFVRVNRREIDVFVADTGELRERIDITDFAYAAHPDGRDFAVAVEGYVRLNVRVA